MAVRSRVYLRDLGLADEAQFLSAARQSQDLHGPWVSPPATRKAFQDYVRRMRKPSNHGFAICERGSDLLIGIIEITNIVLGVFRSGYLGYYAFAGFERQGFMREGLQAVVRQAFRSLRLHRLEANIQPGNAASIALVKSCGFSQEGFSPLYLKIRGRWRDHERWAIVNRKPTALDRGQPHAPKFP